MTGRVILLGRQVEWRLFSLGIDNGRGMNMYLSDGFQMVLGGVISIIIVHFLKLRLIRGACVH